MNLDLVSTNVYSKDLSSKLLIAGTCTLVEWPELVKQVGKDSTILTVCLESTHLNTTIEKIASILAKGDIEEITVITKDGSPHCIGLHFAVEWALKMTKSDRTKVNYYVIEHGTLRHVPAERIKEKRHLSRS
ncbi:4Fe-4S ferredoxin [Candidatus Saccharibacteria bacterium]|nr:4Fe-4S ferredoxin [Candidatus Saccharibacteria bacterium]